MKTIKQFAANSSINEKLIRAVIRQSGDWKYFTENAKNITEHGANAGWGQFIYYTDTCAFYAKNQELILELVNEMADSLGEDASAMVQAFNVIGKDWSLSEIGKTLYGTKSKHDTHIANALAWFALEEVARSYVDFLEG